MSSPCIVVALSADDQPVALGPSQTLALLTEADRAALLEVKRSLSPAKILQYKEIARQDGTELDEEILFASFGPERLKAYRSFFPHRG